MPSSTRLFLASALLVIALGSASVARADTVQIVGSSTGSLATATLVCSFNVQTNTFTFTINNTSPNSARITAIGFDLPGGGFTGDTSSGLNGFTGNVAFQPQNVAFVFSDAALGDVALFDTAVLDFGFRTGADFNNGNPAAGLPPGIAPGTEATFTVSGAGFAGFTEAQICNAVFVRFQQVGPNGLLSDVGAAPGQTPVADPIPEPATVLLLGTGLAGIAAKKVRRRRKVNQD